MLVACENYESREGYSMLEKLACSLGRNDEVPNIELAEMLCDNDDTQGIEEIVAGLMSKEQNVVNDCIKVLYEIGNRKPELIADYVDVFISRLQSKNNRLVWGSMMALATMTHLKSDEVFKKFDVTKKAYETGSVITIDNAISVFAKLCKSDKRYMDKVLPILIKHLETCRPKEVPQHSERAMICIDKDNMDQFIAVLESRRDDLTASQEKRVNKVIKTLVENI